MWSDQFDDSKESIENVTDTYMNRGLDIILDFMQKLNNNNKSNNYPKHKKERRTNEIVERKSKSNNATDLNEELFGFALE